MQQWPAWRISMFTPTSMQAPPACAGQGSHRHSATENRDSSGLPGRARPDSLGRLHGHRSAIGRRHSKRLAQRRAAVKTAHGCATMTSMNTHPACDLSIVIVSWNVWPLLAQCLRSIERASTPVAGNPSLRQFPIPPPPQTPTTSHATLEVIVVDNASHDDTPAHVAAHFPWVQVIASTRNLGFTGGNNRGYAASRGKVRLFSESGYGAGHESRVTSQTSNVKRQTSNVKRQEGRGARDGGRGHARRSRAINNDQ